ncbi:MAG: polysaccharide biosynthesis/export family protein, partial [Thiogranum sp.]
MLRALKFLGAILSLAILFTAPGTAAEDTADNAIGAYEIQPGDQLSVSVWKEENMSQLVVVRPDGYITFPLAGEIQAAGDSIEALRLLIAERLNKYIPDPVVTVSVENLAGNTVYVLGHVHR